jgi:hypothetical protein
MCPYGFKVFFDLYELYSLSKYSMNHIPSYFAGSLDLSHDPTEAGPYGGLGLSRLPTWEIYGVHWNPTWVSDIIAFYAYLQKIHIKVLKLTFYTCFEQRLPV